MTISAGHFIMEGFFMCSQRTLYCGSVLDVYCRTLYLSNIMCSADVLKPLVF